MLHLLAPGTTNLHHAVSARVPDVLQQANAITQAAADKIAQDTHGLALEAAEGIKAAAENLRQAAAVLRALEMRGRVLRAEERQRAPLRARPALPWGGPASGSTGPLSVSVWTTHRFGVGSPSLPSGRAKERGSS